MAACPNKNSQEWQYLVEMAGEEQAYRIFIANGDSVPTMGQTARIVAHLNTETLNSETTLGKKIQTDHNMIAEPDTTADNKYRRGAKFFDRLTESLMPKFRNRKLADSGETAGERQARQIWDRWGHDPSKKIDMGYGEAMDRAEFSEYWNKVAETSRVKGTILHGLFQYLFENDAAKKEKIAQKLEELGNTVGIPDVSQTFGWLFKKNKDGEFYVARQVLQHSGINILENIDPKYKDKVHAETRVVSEEMGIGATIDTLVEHADGYFSIVEWKTGNTFPTQMFNRLMKYGDRTIDITDNPRQNAKLQIMLQAVMLKAANPDVQFRHLRAQWVKDEFQATRDDVYKDVEVRDYLKMVELFLKNEMPEAYKQMLEKSPRLFDADEYGAAPIKIVDQLTENKDDIDVFVKKKMEELAYLRNNNPEGVNNRKIQLLGSEIANLISQGNPEINLNSDGILTASEKDDISVYKRYFGHTGSVSSPLIQMWAKFMKSRKGEVQSDIDTLNKKFKSLVEPVKQEYLSRTGKSALNTAFTKNKVNLINHDQLYAFMWKGHNFVTKNDAEYQNLTQAQKKLVDFVNERVYTELSGIMNKTAYQTPGKRAISFLDIYRQGNRAGFSIYEGFAPKVPATQGEIFKRKGLSKEFFKKSYESYIRSLELRIHDQSREQHGLDIKYLGNPEIEASENYTKNVEVIFDVFMRGLLNKKHMDDVFHMGFALRDILSLKQHGDKTPMFERTMGFIEDRIVSDVMGKRKVSKWSQKPLRLTNDMAISPDEIIRQVKHKVGWSVMWVKPISGLANGLFTHLVTLKEGITGSIGMKFHGLDGRAVDFTAKDFAQAHKDWGNMQKDATLGKIRENKIYLVARKLKYLPDNFDFANRTDEYTTKSNPILEESSFYLAHTIWEEWVAELMMVSMMRRMKLKNGKSVWDSYEVKDVTGEDGITYKDVVWTGGIRGVVARKVGNQTVYENLEGLTWQEIEHMKRVYERVHGAYRKEERTSLELYSMGEAIMQYKKYMPSLLNNLFDSKKEEAYLGDWKKVGTQLVRGKNEDVYEWVARVNEGRARVFVKFLAATSGLSKIFGKGTAEKFKDYRWSELSVEQKKGLINMYTTGAMYMMMLAGYMAMFRDTDDEDSMKKLTRRIIDNFSQQYNPVDLLRTLRNPPAIFSKGFNTVHGTGQLLMASSFYLAGDREDGGKALTQDGNLRGWIPMQKNIPLLSSRYDIVKFLENALEDTDAGLHWDFKNGVIFNRKKD